MRKEDRFSVFELIVLIAAAAPGLALTRSLPDYIAIEMSVMVNRKINMTSAGGINSGLGWSTTGGKYLTSAGRPFRGRPSYWLGHIPCWSAPCLLSLTLATVALGLRGPRPRPRRPARRPGMAAGLAVTLATAVEAMQCLRFLTTSGVMMGSTRDGWPMYRVVVLTSLARLAGLTVAAWWMGLALSGRWSAERDSVGRLGWALGWCWIVMALASELGLWCFSLNY